PLRLPPAVRTAAPEQDIGCQAAFLALRLFSLCSLTARRTLRLLLRLGDACLENLVSRLAIDGLLVNARDRRRRDELCPHRLVDWAQPAARRNDQCALGDAGSALLVEQRDERLTDAEFGDRLLDLERRVRAHGLGRRLDGLLIARRERPQRMLH